MLTGSPQQMGRSSHLSLISPRPEVPHLRGKAPKEACVEHGVLCQGVLCCALELLAAGTSVSFLAFEETWPTQ